MWHQDRQSLRRTERQADSSRSGEIRAPVTGGQEQKGTGLSQNQKANIFFEEMESLPKHSAALLQERKVKGYPKLKDKYHEVNKIYGHGS